MLDLFLADFIFHLFLTSRSYFCSKGLAIQMFPPGSRRGRCCCNCPSDALPCQGGKCSLPHQGDCLSNEQKQLCLFFFRILTTTTKVTASGSRWEEGARVFHLLLKQGRSNHNPGDGEVLCQYPSWQLRCPRGSCHSIPKYFLTFQDFLRKFSRYNFAQYCLGLLFTNRLFKVRSHYQN